MKNDFVLALEKMTGCLTKDQITTLLGTTPDALEKFEQAYSAQVLSEEDPEELNSKQAARLSRKQGKELSTEDIREAEPVWERATAELVSQTSVYIYDGEFGGKELHKKKYEGTPLAAEDIYALDRELRPQAAGWLMKKDLNHEASPLLLYLYSMALDPSSPRELKEHVYHLFRQGLDICDLDPYLYRTLEKNPNSMGYWLPALAEANEDKNFFKIPRTIVAKVPMPLLQLTRIGYENLTKGTKEVVNRWASKVFELNSLEKYFIKTGTYSSKFDFRNACVHSPEEVKEIGEYLLYIHYQALMMASPLRRPCIYGVSTTNEWVVREFIPDSENNPCIYKGLPLHTEYRVFLDCDRKTVLGIVPYWDPATMKKRFGHSSDSDSPHQIHDYIIYQSHEGVLMSRYMDNRQKIYDKAFELVQDLNLPGQWSLDVMQNGDNFWLIDMALAETSAFYQDVVPPRDRRPLTIDWMPYIPKQDRVPVKNNTKGENI